MSTRLTKQGEKPKRTVVPAGRNGHTSGSWQMSEGNVAPNLPVGKPSIPVMTEEEAMNLLARLQDVMSLWQGSDNRIIGGFVMTAFPVPVGMTISKVEKRGGHDKVFCVNGKPIVSVE